MGKTPQNKTADTDKVAILVLGMHRSGTSTLAGILGKVGCQHPMTPMPGNDWNPKGYFESDVLFHLNDDILTAAGTRWDDWRGLNDGWQTSPRFNEFRDRMRETMRSEYGNASLIYIKDPRMCRLMPIWQEVLEGMGYQVVCAHIHRNPIEVAASLERRNRMEPGVSMLVWLRHVLDAEHASRNLPRLFISYEELLEGWPRFLTRAQTEFGFSWPVLALRAADLVGELVDPGLRHHRSETLSFLENPLAPEALSKTFRILERWSKDEENRGDRAQLDKIRSLFNRCVPLFSTPLYALDQAKNQLDALRHERDNEVLSLRAEADATADRMIARDKELIALRADLTAAKTAQEEAAAATRELGESQTRNAELQDQLDAVRHKRDNEVLSLRADLESTKQKHHLAMEGVRMKYMNSTSWKLTKPVRALGRLTRKKYRKPK